MSAPIVKCRDCVFAQPIQTNQQWAKRAPATYALCRVLGLLVKPAKEHGCSRGERK